MCGGQGMVGERLALAARRTAVTALAGGAGSGPALAAVWLLRDLCAGRPDLRFDAGLVSPPPPHLLLYAACPLLDTVAIL